MGVRREDEKFLSGEQFKLFRTSRGLTQQELGEWLGMTKQAVQQLEKRGASRIQALSLSAIDRGLKPWVPTERDLEPPPPEEEEMDGERDQ